MKKQVHTVAALLAALLLAALAAVGSMKAAPSTRALNEGQLISLRDQWTAAPASPDGFRDYVYTIPKLEGSAHTVSLEVFWCSAVLLLDGEELVNYEEPPSMGGTVRLWVDLPEECTGATLTLRLKEGTLSGQRALSGHSYLGSSNAVFAKFIFDNLYALIFGCFTTILGCIVLAGGFFLGHRKSKRTYSSLFLGLFIFFSGIWVVCDSQLPMLFSGHTVRIVFLSFVTFMSMPICLLLYIRKILSCQSRALNILCLLQAANLFVMIVCYLLGRKEPYGTLLTCHFLLMCSVVAVLVLCVRDMRRGNPDIRGVISGFILLGACSIAALVLFYLIPGTNYAYLYSIGMMLFTLCLSITNIRKLYAQLEKSIHAEAYQKLAYSDALTGLENRMAMEEHQKKQLTDHTVYVMIDLNGLKQINDAYGHSAGDAAIIAAAESIQEVFQDIGKCYRIGGDEFLVILEDIPEQTLADAERRLEQSLEQKSQGLPYSVTLALGIARSTEPGETGDSLFSRADECMYQKKEQMKKSSAVSDK